MKLTSLTGNLILSIFVALTQNNVHGQVLINEFLASNTSINQDPDYNEYADWVELYNSTDNSINLNGYYLTDNLDNPDKWRIKADVYIPAKSYLLIWTDGQDNGLHTSFKISQLGEQIGLYSPSLELLDSLTFGEQTIDISTGRENVVSGSWKYFFYPTPGAANTTTSYIDIVRNVPEYSITGGLYNSGLSVELSTDLGGTIRYTLDGSEPDFSSPPYSGPIQVNQTTIIRSRIFKPYEIPGRIVTHSYFINENFETRNLPVISISTNPDNFWDTETGIYVQDFKPEWGVPINIEMFENNGSDRAAFNELAGTKVNGLYSWQLPQKMLGIYFRKQYGVSGLDYQLFFEKDRKSFKSFALRASGSDWSYTMFRDGMMHLAVDYNMEIDYMSFRPCVVYVNGQYMGIHNIREKVDEDFIVGNHNIEKGAIDMVEYEEYAEAGDLNAYNTFKGLYMNDLSNQSNYDTVAQIMDIENFTDYLIAEIYSGNYSIEHNVMVWKPKGSGKWKWILMDLDRGLFAAESRYISTFLNKSVWPFNSLFNNAAYKQYFAKRLAGHLYTTFNKTRMLERIDYHWHLIENEMPNHIDRWLGTTSSYGNAIPSMNYWYDELDVLKTYVNERPAALLNDLATYGFSTPSTLSLDVSPSKAGSFEINTLKVPKGSWTGLYPKNMSFNLQAIPKPGYIFKGWKNSVSQSSFISTNPAYSASLTGNLNLVAIFEATGECIFPEIISENTTLNKACSPYLVQGDITIPENITLTIEPGVEIWLTPASNFTINGNIIAHGSAEERIIFKMNPAYEGQSWGALCFTETSDTSSMDYVSIEDALHGPIPITQPAAISAYKSDLVLDHMILEKINCNPIAGRYSSISLSNSSLHSNVTGDLINVKYGRAKIVNCVFRGNKCPDTDAIDYDEIENGIIRNCQIRDLEGFNSDAIDIGEKATNVTIDSLYVCNITDKGISVGQRSTVSVTNSIFVNCNLGVGLKDSCRAFINHCTFYGVGTPVACFEKNLGSAGGNGSIKNSILSNSYTASYSSDNKSTIEITNCISDNTELPDNGTNLFGNPLFTNPTFFNFNLLSGSPSINTANDNGVLSDMGSVFQLFTEQPPVMISKIFYNALNSVNKHEFVGILNPGNEPVDLSGYKLTKGVEFTFPQGIILEAGQTVIVSKDKLGPLLDSFYPKSFTWNEGSLSNEGETVQLADSSGIVVDQVIYSPNSPWPDVTTGEEKVLSLVNPAYDNHFGENWTTEEFGSLVTGVTEPIAETVKIYPNPTTGIITIETENNVLLKIEIYTITGLLVHSEFSITAKNQSIDLSSFKNQILLIKVGNRVEKLIVLDN